MNIQGIVYCDFCCEAIFPEDVAPVKIKVDGITHQFHYHNSLKQPCLKKELDLMRQRFAAQAQ